MITACDLLFRPLTVFTRSLLGFVQLLFVVFILIDPLFQMTIWLIACIHLYFGKVRSSPPPQAALWPFHHVC